MSNYIIAIDRYGSPYLQHTVSRGHRYIAKIGEGAKARYFYTQEQVRAYQQNRRSSSNSEGSKPATLSSNVKTRQKNVTGTAKVGSIGRRGEGLGTGPVGNRNGTTSSGTRSYLGTTTNGATTTTVSSVPGKHTPPNVQIKKTTDVGQELKDKVATKANKVKEKVKDWAGVDERERRDAAMKETTKAINNKLDAEERLNMDNARREDKDNYYYGPERRGVSKSQYENSVKKADDKLKKAISDDEKAQKEYDKTPLGALEMAKQYAHAGAYTVGETVKKAKEKAHDDMNVALSKHFDNDENRTREENIENGEKIRKKIKEEISDEAEHQKSKLKSKAERMKDAFKKKDKDNKSKKEEEIKETIIPEKKIEETIIPEKKIEETIIPEKKIEETIIPEKKIEETIIPEEYIKEKKIKEKKKK